MFPRHQDPLFFRWGWSVQVCNTSRPPLFLGWGWFASRFANMKILLCLQVGLVFPCFQDIKTPCFSGGGGLSRFATHQDPPCFSGGAGFLPGLQHIKPSCFAGGWSFQVCKTSRSPCFSGGPGLSKFATHQDPLLFRWGWALHGCKTPRLSSFSGGGLGFPYLQNTEPPPPSFSGFFAMFAKRQDPLFFKWACQTWVCLFTFFETHPLSVRPLFLQWCLSNQALWSRVLTSPGMF